MDESDLLAIDRRLRAASLQPVDPLALDRQIARAEDASYRWVEGLAEDENAGDDPLGLHRELTERKTWEALDALPEGDPLRPYLQRWIYRLTELQINRRVYQGLTLLRRSALHPVEKPESTRASLQQMLLRALRDARGASAWLESYVAASLDLSLLTSKLWQRRAELARRRGFSTPPVLAVEGMPCEQIALTWLEGTDDLFYDFRREHLADLIALGLGGETRVAWPAHLSWRSLSDLFRKGQLLDSLRLRSKRLPERLAPASFLRGLCRLGEEWSQALLPIHQPFVVAHDPYRLQVHRDGALFASLIQGSTFLRSRFDVGVQSLSAVRRSVALSLLIESRARALKVVLGAAALRGRNALGEAFVELTERSFGVHLPPGAAGAVWRLDVEDPQRFSGLLLAYARNDELVRAHDEDWFDNPRGIEQLRSEAALPPQIECTSAELTRGADRLRGALESAL